MTGTQTTAGRRVLGLSPRQGWLALVVILVAGIGAIVAEQAIPDRLGTGGDAAVYMGVARNIDAGQGITSPYVNELDSLPPATSADRIGRAPLLLWPPLYPVALASGSTFGLDPETTAHLLHLASVALAGGFVVLLTYRLSHRSASAGFVAGLGFVLSTAVQSSVIASYADPLFMALALGGVLVLAHTLRKPSWPAVGAFTMIAAAGALTRYVGFGIVAGGGLCLLTAPSLPRRKRVGFALLVALAAIPALGWLVHVRGQVPNAIGDSRVVWRSDIWSGLAEAAGQWTAPSRLPAGWRLLSFISAAILVVPAMARGIAERARSARRPHRESHNRGGDSASDTPSESSAAWRASAWVAAGLLTVIVGSAMTIGAQLSVNGRMVLTVEAIAIAWFTAGAASSLRLLRQLDVPAPAVAVLVALPLTIVLTGVVWTAVLNAERPFTSPLVAEATPAEAAELARTLRDTTAVFANSPTELYVLTDKGSAALPLKVRPSTNDPNPNYDRELDELRTLLKERNGAIVFFASAQVFNPNLPNELDFTLAQPGRWETIEISPAIRVVRPVPGASPR